MIGALIGDLVGSAYEFNNARTQNFDIFTKYSRSTDDSVLTCAVFETLYQNSPIDYSKEGLDKIKRDLVNNMLKWCAKYPYAGYGGRFYEWIKGYRPRTPYNSFGNGSAMRTSPVAYFANNEDEVKLLSKACAEITHNHIEGIKGAECVSMCIYYALNGKDKEFIKNKVIANYYPRLKDLDYDNLVKTNRFNETCQGSVPEAIYCFLYSNDFKDCLVKAISIGGDSDTIACIACSIGEAYYKDIPTYLYEETYKRLKPDMQYQVELFKKIVNNK